MRMVDVNIENWGLHSPFRIARDTKTNIEVVVVTISEMLPNGTLAMGWGECRPYGRYDETPAGVVTLIEGIRGKLENDLTSEALQSLLPPGAARNAVDCALIDLEASVAGKTVPEMLGLSVLNQCVTAETISIDTPEAMGARAEELANAPLIKVKLDGDQVIERVTAIRAKVPNSKLIIDANEAWTMEQLAALQQPLLDLGVVLIEQPLPECDDEALLGFEPLIPLCADESCHGLASLKGLKGRYQMVNIKLDKAGGLTEAHKMAKSAKAEGFGVFLGCMVSTSLAIAPASLLWSYADHIDLDGPAWLKVDRDDGFKINEGEIKAASPALWGHPFQP